MQELLTTYKPTAQLVVYTNDNKSYIEHHDIFTSNNKQYLSEGKPLTKKALKNMLDLVLTSDKSIFATVDKLLPENVLSYDPRPGKTKLVWYEKSGIKLLHGIYKKPVKVKLPAFVFVLNDDVLSIYAMKTGTKRPDLKTVLFHSPLPNVYQEGNVCMGNVKKPNRTIEIADLIMEWQKAFWGSEFTNHLWDDSVDRQLKQAIRTRVQFPNKLLKPTKKTLNTLLK